MIRFTAETQNIHPQILTWYTERKRPDSSCGSVGFADDPFDGGAGIDRVQVHASVRASVHVER
jgi:hypothetical protein